MGCGADVINVGLCTTPGTEMAVITHKADGGIIITASHNPKAVERPQAAQRARRVPQ